jgi:predicted GTPase
MVIQLQKYMKQEEEQGDLVEKLKQAEQQLKATQDALKKAKEEIMTTS